MDIKSPDERVPLDIISAQHQEQYAAMDWLQERITDPILKLLETGYEREGSSFSVVGPNCSQNACEPVDGNCSCGRKCDWELEIKVVWVRPTESS